MIVYRLTKGKYRSNLSGKGAELFGGRWNPIGVPALYTSENRALCILEFLAHTPKNIIPPDLELLSIEVPNNNLVSIKNIEELPIKWDSLETNSTTQQIGRKHFEQSDCLGIIVPSAIIKQEYNIVLNPLSRFYHHLEIVDNISIDIDERLMN